MCRVSVCLVQRRFIYCESLSYLICVCEWCKCDIYACARVCVRAYVRAHVCVCVYVHARVCMCVVYIQIQNTLLSVVSAVRQIYL